MLRWGIGMDLISNTPPLIASLSWLLQHWLPIIVAPSTIGALALGYRWWVTMGNARWQADKCLKREKENEVAWESDKKRSDAREAYLTERVTKLQTDLGALDSLVDYLQKRQIEDATKMLMTPSDTTTPPTMNSPDELTPPANPPASSMKKQ